MILLLVELIRLKKLNLTGCRVTDEGVSHLSILTDLNRIDLSHCNKITNEGLCLLSHLTNLAYISLFSCKRITDTGLSYISHMNIINLELKTLLNPL